MSEPDKIEQTQNIHEGKADPERSRGAWWQPALAVFARMSGWIAAPVIIALFVGKWLDRKYGTAPWLLLLTVGASFLVSMVGIVKEAVGEYKKIERNGNAGNEPIENKNKE